MPALKNTKHEAFAQAVATGMPASQAYVEFISDKCSAATAETNGPKLARDAQVKLRISELRMKLSNAAEKKFGLTKEKWLDRLENIASKAEEIGDLKAATGALTQIGKAVAYYAPEEIKHSGSVEIPGLAEAVAATFGRK
jgi:hypothetical protein